MTKLYLYLTDLFVPIFFGIFYTSFFLIDINFFNNYFFNFIFFGITLFLVSLLNNYYREYYSIHFSDKIRISFVTSFIAVFVQLIIYIYLPLTLNLVIIIFWILIPVVILIIKYFIKNNIQNANSTTINIIGTFYKFNEYEMLTLSNKGFTIFFFDSVKSYYGSKHSNKLTNIVNVINYDKNNFNELKEYEYLLVGKSFFYLDEFMEKYLRKIFTNFENIIINLNTYSRLDFLLKRLIDYTIVIILMPILVLFSIIISILKIRYKIFDSLLFVQKRYGINKIIFNVYKIRTMNINSETQGNTKKNDPRIYPFAMLIRKLRIDELPQIFNVLIGNMHMVGPRAEWIDLSDQYSININNYNYRHVVRPGITGWAQIIYPYGLNEEDARQKLMYDLYYIKHWNVWLELEVCIKTFMVILDKRGF
jgi:lipopolysaccharide/colanic/teichoic acid biosynthesis glycosyltransferase